MKRLIVLLTVSFLFGFNKTDTKDVVLKATKIQPLSVDKCAVSLELHNQSDRKISYLSMYCSYDGFYVTDNPNVKVSPRPCDKNFPTTKTIPVNSYHTVNLELEMAKNSKAEKFKIGFKLVEIPKGVKAIEFDSSKVKSVTVWSNAMEYKER